MTFRFLIVWPSVSSLTLWRTLNMRPCDLASGMSSEVGRETFTLPVAEARMKARDAPFPCQELSDNRPLTPS